MSMGNKLRRRSVLALIPARGGSKRVPRKNARKLNGRSLIDWTISAALEASTIDHVILSSDCQELLELGRQSGAAMLTRPDYLAGDEVDSVDVALHVLDQEKECGRFWDVICLLQPTSPFRAPGRIDQGINLLRDSGEPAVVSVVPAASHPFHCYFTDERGRLLAAAVDKTGGSSRSQDLPPAFALNGAFYALWSDELRESKSFLPPRTVGLICDAPGEEIDIDTEADFLAAQSHLDRLRSR